MVFFIIYLLIKKNVLAVYVFNATFGEMIKFEFTIILGFQRLN